MIPVISPQAVWGVMKVIHYHPRFRYGFLTLLSGAALRYVILNLYYYWRTQKNIATRKSRASKKKQAIKQQCEDIELQDILEKDIEDLLKDLKSGALTAEEVLRIFQKKALELDEDLNMITEPIMEAVDQARMLDQLSDKTGLLHGMPVSIKENLGLAGLDSTGGMTYFLDEIAKEDSVVVKVLKKHGAIPFVRTNVPQTMMSFCSSNQIYGETSNPHDHTRGPGGSSSGEGAIVGGGGAFIGIGSDIGGSIRAPAAFCGCYALKPTYGRISYKGSLSLARGSLPIQACVCPIAKDLKSLVLLSKVLMSEDMYQMDPQLSYIPFNEERANKTGSMRIGYYTFDGNVQCQPAIVRGVMESKAALEKMGHTLIPVDISAMTPPGFNMPQMFARLTLGDRFQKYKQLLKYEKYEKGINLPLSLSMFPPWLLRKMSFVVSFKDKLASQLLAGAVGFRSVVEYVDHIADFRNWQDKFMESWLEMKLDAIICPVFPTVAPKKAFVHEVTPAGVYTMLYNSLNYPSGVLPVTKVTEEDVRKTLDPNVHKPSLMIEKLLMKSVEGSEGMPVGIQCVALPFRDETCLRVMREVEAGLRN